MKTIQLILAIVVVALLIAITANLITYYLNYYPFNPDLVAYFLGASAAFRCLPETKEAPKMSFKEKLAEKAKEKLDK